MNIDVVKQIFELISNSYQMGKLSGSEFNLLVNQASRDYQDFLIGLVEQYTPGRPVPRVGLGMSSEISTKLSPFKKDETTITVASGMAAKPADFRKLSSMKTTTGLAITEVEDDRFSSYFNSEIDPVATNPFYVQYSTYYKIYPANTASILLNYYTVPPDAVWGFSVTGNREVYNSGASTDLLWKDSEMSAIIARMLKPFGISLKDGEIVQYSNQVINNGE